MHVTDKAVHSKMFKTSEVFLNNSGFLFINGILIMKARRSEFYFKKLDGYNRGIKWSVF